MQNQTMDVFKKLAVVRRRNHCSGSVVSEEGVDDNDFCYHQHGNDSDTEMADNAIGVASAPSDSGNSGIFSSLYGRRRSDTRASMMAVVTSTKFDNDETFSIIARALIHRHQIQNMSEREAINSTLEKTDDLRAFIEALDMKFTVLSTQNTDGNDIIVDDALSEIIIRTRSIFDATLKAMWREKECSSKGLEMMEQEEKYVQYEDEFLVDNEHKRQHPKTPKNLRMSPMRTSAYNYKNHGVISQSESCDSACSEGSNNSIFHPFKRRRYWFFPQNKKASPPFLPSVTKLDESSKKVFPMRGSLPKFHFDLGGGYKNSTSKTTMIFGDLSRNKPVQSLKLDGTASSYACMGNADSTGLSSSSYMPPTSPIRKVSVELKGDNNNTIV